MGYASTQGPLPWMWAQRDTSPSLRQRCGLAHKVLMPVPWWELCGFVACLGQGGTVARGCLSCVFSLLVTCGRICVIPCRPPVHFPLMASSTAPVGIQRAERVLRQQTFPSVAG